MTKGRLEAFSDGVIAIIITIMALELKVPKGAELSALWPLIPVFFSYVLSFLFIGIYWNNHHHLMQAAKAVNGRVLWANLHLLFWLSLVPFTTGWMGQNDFAPWPVALYGFVLLLAGCSYTLASPIAGDSSRAGLVCGDGHRKRFERELIAADLRHWYSFFICEFLDRLCAVYCRGNDLVDS